MFVCRYALASPPGPVHLNLQFREPLAPVNQAWDAHALLQGLGTWQAGQGPLTTHIQQAAGTATSSFHTSSSGGGVYGSSLADGSEASGLRHMLAGARRGLIVVGELTDPRDIAAAVQMSQALGWPVVADVLSGLRIGSNTASSSSSNSTGKQAGNNMMDTVPSSPAPGMALVSHMDHLLLGNKEWWSQLAPDVILQLGPHLTSKRLAQFMDWCALGEGQGMAQVPWVYVAPHSLRHDPSHLVTHRAVMGLTAFRDDVVLPAAAMAAGAQQYAAEGDAVRERIASHSHASSSGIHAPSGQHGASSGSNGASTAGLPQGDAACSPYARLLVALDRAASWEIDAAIRDISFGDPLQHTGTAGMTSQAGMMQGIDAGMLGMAQASSASGQGQAGQLNEPFVARTLARSLPAGHAIYLGNSMPIRDMDMYATTLPDAASTAELSQPTPSSSSHSHSSVTRGSAHTASSTSAVRPFGAAVGANRGASGIDGVLSTAAGFAAGVSRPCSLLIGDLSFLHDINGLNMLRSGEARPPLTVVLVNNAGGGIFSFLPIAGV